MTHPHSIETTAAPSALDDPFVLAGRSYRSRLIVGTGKYRDFATTRDAVERSGAEIVTVAVRRVNITDAAAENLLDYLDPRRYTILPNTAGCYTAEDAVRTCRLARDAGVGSLVKLEVIGDERTLFPDVTATIASGLGIRNPYNIRIILEQSRVPVIVDAGVGTASDAAAALELGCDAVLMNSAIDRK